tara:strand:- start:9824 stop:12073 length:2250 start_codon:yes stop_codon:yes gene_type:complete
MLKRYLIFIFVFLLNLSLFSQSNFYDTDTIREVRLYFYDSDWDYQLDSLYVQGDNERILADLIIDGDVYDSVGVRYKGFSSVSVNRLKNPFNIKLDYIIEGQDHQGVDKLKLSNIYQDPSFIREVLSYEVCRKYMPASQANFTNLYINDTLWGLYTNVEAVNKSFLIDHFDSKYNAFFKCNPENINIQIGGENSNLSNTHGLDSSDYYPFYSLKSNHGWEDLYNLIDTLNTFSDSVYHVLNIDRTLWMHALNYSMINFDSYIGYSQNYYLYRDHSGQWNPIIWDLNMSFGGFRLTDASQSYFNGFDILQAQEMDPLIHHSLMSVSPRPLLKKLFQKERNRKMYLAHIRTIIEENFANQDYFSRGQSLQNLIDQDVQNDTNKFYSYLDFTNNLTNQVSLTASMCPGITELMDSRSAYLSSYPGYSGEPIISNISYSSQNPTLGDDIWITAEVLDATFAAVAYRFGKNERFKLVEMYDDGNHNDGISGDGIYGGKISNCSNSVDYYLYADNDSAGVFSPERAAYEYYTIQFGISIGDLVINEIMSNNVSVASDNTGKYEDWIELYNTTNSPISTNGLFLTDTLAYFHKWDLPNYVIQPNSYLIIWADEDGNQGEEHANFQLSNFGEQVLLSNTDSSVIDSITYLPQLDDIAFGRSPNGLGQFTMLTPTFNGNNDFPNLIDDINESIKIYPNPFSDVLYFDKKENIVVRDILGKIIYSLPNTTMIQTSNWDSGVYFISLKDKNQIVKVIKIK